MSSRNERIYRLATKITDLLRKHENRAEAVDAHDMARIMFRRPVPNRDQTYFAVPEESLESRL